MLSVSNISKSFNYRSVLKDVSFTLNAGETVVIMGKNGAGKTTLLRIIARIMACEKGKILFQNQNLFDGEPSIRKNQNTSPNPNPPNQWIHHNLDKGHTIFCINS